MAKPKLESHRQIYLKTFFQNHITLKARLALLTLYNVRFSNWFEIGLLIWEYLQLISQIILFLPDLSEVYHPRLIFRVVVYSCKLINPSYLLSFDNTDTITASIITLILICTVLKYLILVYIVGVSYWDMRESQTIIKIWRVIFKTQGRVFCYFTCSFWIRAILNVRDDGFNLYGMGENSAIAFMTILWVIEYLFAFAIETQFCDILPAKSLLSAKNYHLQITTMTQKMALQILQLALKGNLKSRLWVSSIFTLVSSLIRVQIFFATLPLYKLQALLHQVRLNSIVLGFSIAYFFQAIMMSTKYDDPNEEFVIVIGFILSCFLVKGSEGLLRELVGRIFSTDIAENVPNLLMHKTIFLKQLLKNEKLNPESTAKYHWTFLVRQTVGVHQEMIFNSAINLESSNLAEVKKMSLTYLENLGMKFQKHRLTQLYLSSMSLKSLKFSSKALKTIGSTIKKPWSVEYVSSLFLLCKFKEILTKDYKEKNNILDLTGFIRDQKVLSELKQKMINQAEMQISIGRNILREKCDFGEIFDKSQGISNLRSTIHKEIRVLPSKVSEHSSEHLLLCAQYYLVLEFSQRLCQTFCENYHLKYIKHKRHLDSPDLSEENLYQSSNAFLIIAGQSKENGIVKYCSKSIESALGGNNQGYHASHISSLFLPSMQNHYRNLFKKIFEKDNIHLLDRVHKVFLIHKKGYVTESQIYLQVHPYLNENIYVSMILRNTSTSGDYLILKENGDIEGATQRISKQLGLDLLPSTSSVKIKTISDDLALANEAFNMVNSKKTVNESMKASERLFVETQTPGISSRQMNQILDQNQASELYNVFSSDGKEITVKPINQSGKSIEESYHCIINVRSFEGTSLKIAKLTRVKKSVKKIQHEDLPLSSQRFSPDLPLETVQETQNDAIVSPVSVSNYWKMKTGMMTTDGNLLSPIEGGVTGNDTNRITSDRKFLIEEKQEDYYEGEEEGSEEGRTEVNSNVQDVEKQRGENLADFLSVTTATFKSSQEKAVYRAYRNNIRRKSYSKSFKFLCLTFYGVILMTLLSQVVLKLVYDSTMNDLIVRKDLLNYAQSRSYYVSKVCYSLMAIYGFAVGINIWTLPGSLTQPPSSIIGALPMFYQGLVDANTGIVNLLDQITDDNIRNELFKKDIQVNGSIYLLDDNSMHYQTSFEVVELLIAACQYFMNKDNQLTPDSKAVMEYIRKNGENGFLVKNFEITDIFQASVNNQREYLKNFILVCLILTPILLSGVAVLLAAIIWRQYNEEVSYLQAFIKLDSSSIKSILKDMEILKNAIMNDSSFEDRGMIEFFWANSVCVKDAQIRTRHSRRDNQKHDYFKLQKRYFYYTLQVILFVGLLIGILLWNFISADHRTNIIYNHQSQLQLSNQLSERISIVVQGLPELFQTNNTGQYVEMSPLDYVEGSLSELKTLQNTIISGFIEWDGTYDPQIKTLLFDGPPCSEYQDHFNPYCVFLESQGVLTNVISLTSYVLGLIENKLDQYHNMNTSAWLDLYAVCYKGANGFAVSTSLLAYQAQVMNSIIDINLTKSISDANKNQNTILAIFVVCLVLVSFLIWIQILKRIKEVRNDFKKVLQVLPPQLILSSFLLKQFLSKISNMVHDT